MNFVENTRNSTIIQLRFNFQQLIKAMRPLLDRKWNNRETRESDSQFEQRRQPQKTPKLIQTNKNQKNELCWRNYEEHNAPVIFQIVMKPGGHSSIVRHLNEAICCRCFFWLPTFRLLHKLALLITNWFKRNIKAIKSDTFHLFRSTTHLNIDIPIQSKRFDNLHKRIQVETVSTFQRKQSNFSPVRPSSVNVNSSDMEWAESILLLLLLLLLPRITNPSINIKK